MFFSAFCVWFCSFLYLEYDFYNKYLYIVLLLGLFDHVVRLPTVIPASAALSIPSTATDGVSPMSDWKRSQGRLPKTWLKLITVDTDTTAADAEFILFETR